MSVASHRRKVGTSQGRDLAWDSFVWLCSRRGWAIPLLVEAQHWVVAVHLSSPGTTWGKTGSSEEKPFCDPVGTGTGQANHGRARGLWFDEGPSNLLHLSSHSPPLLQQKNGKCVELCVSSREQLTLSRQSCHYTLQRMAWEDIIAPKSVQIWGHWVVFMAGFSIRL